MKSCTIKSYNNRQKRIKQQPPSVIKSFDLQAQINERVAQGLPTYLLGIKDTDYIPTSIIDLLQENNFIPHTIDKMSRGGRAVDIDLINPITTKVMTGSSSGTAVNVLEGFNDIGIGSDGGGSVLAPAMSVNLYSIMSPLFYRNDNFKKSSTDGITFIPSLGFMSKNIELIKTATKLFVDISEADCINVVIPQENNLYLPTKQDIGALLKRNIQPSDKLEVHTKKYPDIFGDRTIGMQFLKDTLEEVDVVVSYEGPIDYYGLGDSVFGLFNKTSRNIQKQSGKGLLRVVNMVDFSALSIPSNDFATGYLLICKSTNKGISALFEVAKQLSNQMNNPLYNRYFTL